MGPRSNVVLLAAACIVACMAASPAHAATEDCIQCRHVDCIKGLIKQKTAMAAGYDALAKKWDPLVKVEGKPSDMVDFNTITDSGDRTEFYRDLLKKFDAMVEQENALASQVGLAPGCGEFVVEVKTDTYRFCEVDAALLQRSQEKAPCRQIGKLLARH